MPFYIIATEPFSKATLSGQQGKAKLVASKTWSAEQLVTPRWIRRLELQRWIPPPGEQSWWWEWEIECAEEAGMSGYSFGRATSVAGLICDRDQVIMLACKKKNTFLSWMLNSNHWLLVQATIIIVNNVRKSMLRVSKHILTTHKKPSKYFPNITKTSFRISYNINITNSRLPHDKTHLQNIPKTSPTYFFSIPKKSITRH